MVAITELSERVLRRLAEGTLGREILAEDAEQRHERRKAAVAEIERFEKERLTTLPALQASEERARAGVEQALAKLEEARRKYQIARAAVSEVNHRADHGIARLQGILRELQPASIVGFLRWLVATREAVCRRPFPHAAINAWSSGEERERAKRDAQEWHAAQDAAFAAIAAARERTEHLPFEPLSDSEIGVELDKLRRAVEEA